MISFELVLLEFDGVKLVFGGLVALEQVHVVFVFVHDLHVKGIFNGFFQLRGLPVVQISLLVS